MDDLNLLQEYAKEGSEKAFAIVVARHVDFVYAAAFRRVRDQHLAEEITQNVFIILARKASQLDGSTVLTAWLYRTARYAASDVLKSEYRRRLRERHAMALQSAGPDGGGTLEHLEPRLDDLLARLPESDRTVVLLRFFESKSLREVGKALGIEEEAARKRVARAVAKLRSLLHARDLTVSAATLAALLASQSAQAAPAGLAVHATTAALAEAAGLSTSILALVKTTIRSMLWSKSKIILGTGAALAALAIFLFVFHHGPGLPRPADVAARHLLASGAGKLHFIAHPPSPGADCMNCHRASRTQPLFIHALTARGNWRGQRQPSIGQFEIRLGGANQIIETTQGDLGNSVRGWDGRIGWKCSAGLSPVSLSVEEIEALRRDADFLAWPSDERWRSAVRIARFAERQCYRVDWTDGAGRLGARYFDIQSGLQFGTTSSPAVEGGFAVTRVLSNYRSFGGILMPATMTRIDPGREEVFELTSVVIADLAATDFAPPEEILDLLKSASAQRGRTVD